MDDFRTVLSVISFALGCGGFFALLIGPESQVRRSRIMVTTFILFILVGAVLFWNIWRREATIKEVSQRILAELKTERAADEIVSALFPHNPPVIYEALDRLAIAQQVKSRIADTEDERKLQHKVRLYSIPSNGN